MSDKPIILKCNLFISPAELLNRRDEIIKQFEDHKPIVTLPYGFELAAVDADILKRIRKEIGEKATMHQDGDIYIRHFDAVKIIDEAIKEIEGKEQKV